jgi:uncharacterized membrane protein
MDITPGSDTVAPSHVRDHGEGHTLLLEGKHLKFPTFKHNHPAVINVNKVADERMTLGQRVADKVAATMGSWKFIISQALLMILWVTFNSAALFFHFDGYPFILLNLAMSAQAAFATPLIMMSQNRQAEKDRLTAQNDYATDCKGEEEIRHIMEHLDHQDDLILQIVKRLEEQHMEMREQLAQLDPTLMERLGVDAVKISKEIVGGDNELAGNS